ncbi:MAG: A/G-specific adenine glycosylase [Planctomycetota bacterium]
MTATEEALPFDSAWLRNFRRKLRAWYDQHARELPWRGTRDPYAVWLSEIMLQQTQVETVKPYFQRFLTALPTILALAQADEQVVLRLWEGLGYYRRARQLHQAARRIVADYDGCFPCDPQSVEGLPGIGRYTAGAILSIAFDQRRPILEANTVRVFARLLAYNGQTTSSAGQKLLWAAAEAVLPSRDVGRFNQALMELGSKVCRPRELGCEVCPALGLCYSQQRGLQHEIPCPKPRPQFEKVAEAVVLVRRRGRVLLIRWPEGRRWAGLWDFPRFAVQGEKEAEIHREIIGHVLRLTGVTISPGKHRKTLRHSVTRFRITLDCYDAEYVSHNGGGTENLVQKWVRPAELEHYPLSSTGRTLAGLVSKLISADQ